MEETKKAEELLTKVRAQESPLEQEKISKESQKQIDQLKIKIEAFKKEQTLKPKRSIAYNEAGMPRWVKYGQKI